METAGAFFDAEWESICKLFSVEESDSSAHMLDYSPPASKQDDNLTFTAPLSFSYESNQSLMGSYSDENYLHGNGYADNALFSGPCYNDLPVLNDVSLGMLLVDDARNEAASTHEGSSTPMDNASDLNSANQSSCSTELTLKRKLDTPILEDQIEEKTSSMATTRKKAHISKTGQKGKRKAQPEKEKVTAAANAAEETGAAHDNSEDESNISEEITEVAESESNQETGLTSTGKKRASRGAATDPQSLYARRRRMRINERLRILQNLVPNGTKVDISTMLEEAFQYVKFLQLQIRLLSSDDLWMYAPLAYNGFDVGAYRRMPPFLGL